jgi:hypothetical protein
VGRWRINEKRLGGTSGRFSHLFACIESVGENRTYSANTAEKTDGRRIFYDLKMLGYGSGSFGLISVKAMVVR